MVRIRPLHAAVVMLHVLLSRKRRQRFVKRHSSSQYLTAWREFWDGLYANRNEYWYYQNSRDPRVMATERQLLGGWIIIQRRGKPIAPDELATMQYLPIEDQEDRLESGKHWQFCRHPDDGRIVLVDYGRQATLTTLINTGGSRLIESAGSNRDPRN
jgi:hypothetical protein